MTTVVYLHPDLAAYLVETAKTAPGLEVEVKDGQLVRLHGAEVCIHDMWIMMGNDTMLFRAVGREGDLLRLTGLRLESLTNHGADESLVQHLACRVRPTLEKMNGQA